MKALFGRFALIAGGLLLPLLMFEVGVRLTGLAPPPKPNPTIWEPHPLFGWWHIPYSGGNFHSDYNEFETEVRINARGLRDREIGYDNPDDALRILSLADSFGEALQVELEKTYHKQLEVMLGESLARPVEVLNAGVGGWGTDQEAIFYLAEGFRYNPDVVLLAFFVRNDAVNNYGPLEIARNGGRQQKQFFALSPTGDLIPPAVQESSSPGEPEEAVFQEESDTTAPLLGLADGLWQYSAMYRFLVPYLRDIPQVVQTVGPSGLLGGEAVIRANHPTTPIPFYVYQTPLSEDFESAWRLTEAIIVGLRDEVDKRGSRLVVMLIAAPEQVYPETRETVVAQNPQLQSSSWDLEAPNRRLTAFLESEEIPYLDLLPVFRMAKDEPGAPSFHFRHDQHWTDEGHRLAAEALHAFLLDTIETNP